MQWIGKEGPEYDWKIWAQKEGAGRVKLSTEVGMLRFQYFTVQYSTRTGQA